MWNKFILVLIITLSLSGCDTLYQYYESIVSQTQNNPETQPTPPVQTTPEVQPTPPVQTTPEVQPTPTPNTQYLLPYDPTLQGRLIQNPELFALEVNELFSTPVKDKFETTKEFEDKVKKNKEELRRKAEFSFDDTFVLIFPLKTKDNSHSDSYSYNADTQDLSLNLSFYLGLRYLKSSSSRFNGVYLWTQGSPYLGVAAFLFPNYENINNSSQDETKNLELDKYWLLRKNKFDPSFNPNSGGDGSLIRIRISNLDPTYAKEIITEERMNVQISFKLIDDNERVISNSAGFNKGQLVNIRIVDSKTGTILWVLNE